MMTWTPLSKGLEDVKCPSNFVMQLNGVIWKIVDGCRVRNYYCYPGIAEDQKTHFFLSSILLERLRGFILFESVTFYKTRLFFYSLFGSIGSAAQKRSQ